MSFVPYISKWYKLASVWMFTLIGVLSVVQPNLADLGAPDNVQGYVTGAPAALGILSRLASQPPLTATREVI